MDLDYLDRKRLSYAKEPDKNFRGRQKEIKDFHSRLRRCKRRPVWALYGPGGVGKSELLKHLAKLARDSGSLSAYVDLGLARVGSDVGLLKEIVADLDRLPENRDGFLGFRRLLGRLRRAPLESRFPHYHKAFDNLKRVQQKRPSTAEVLADTASMVGAGADLAATAMGSPTAPGTKALRTAAIGALKSSLKAGDQDALEKGLRSVVLGLLTDLKHLVDQDGDNSPVVLVFDTCEQAIDVQKTTIKQLAWDCWSEGLPVLFILAGRDPLDWERTPEDGDAWTKERLITSQPLGDLPDNEARDYLKQRGVTEPALVKRILKFTGGFPMFLRLACDVVDMTPGTQTQIAESFPERRMNNDMVTKFLVERIVDHLPEEHKDLEETIRVLAIPRWFDRSVFALLLGKQASHIDKDWRTLTGTSLVERTDIPGRFKFYDCIREALLRWWDEIEQDQSSHHRDLAQYHASQKEDFAHIRECLYHKVAYEPEETIHEWEVLCKSNLSSMRMERCQLLLSDAACYPIQWASMEDEVQAATHCRMAYVLAQYPTTRAWVVEERIVHYQAALGLYTEDGFPEDWAMVEHNLGNAYCYLPTGDKGHNLTLGIECFNAALRVYTEGDHPREWAMTHNNLGNAWSSLPTGDRNENLIRAIECFKSTLRVYTEQEFPERWAMAQNNLGVALSDVRTGDEGENHIKAIECFTAALRVYTESAFPLDWARTQNNLGTAYGELPIGDKGENLMQAIGCFQAALHVYTERDFPEQWASAQGNLGNVYAILPTGEARQNLECAIEYYRASLRVYTEKEFPWHWARTQSNLGFAYLKLAEFSNPLANLACSHDFYLDAARGYGDIGCPRESGAARSRAMFVDGLLKRVEGQDTPR